MALVIGRASTLRESANYAMHSWLAEGAQHMNSHHAKRTLKESMGYKVFAVFMAFTLCLPTTLTSNLTNMRQAQAATEAAQEYAFADGGDSAATDTDSSFDSSSDAAQGSSSENRWK